MRAEFQHEIDEMGAMRSRMNSNVRGENERQKEKIAKLKAKYDREGVNYVNDENEMGRKKNPGPQVGEMGGMPPELPRKHPSYKEPVQTNASY